MDAARDDAATAQVVARLKRQIEALEAQPRTWLLALRTGVTELDEWGVFRLGGGVELSGEEASGRTSLALSVVAAACREARLSAWVDGPSELYPPAALSYGVELERLLIVRPKAPGQLVWSAVQLLRSGAFTCVVLDVTHTGVRLSLTETKKLLDAARAGGSLLVLLTSQGAQAQGLVRLELACGVKGLTLVPSPPSRERGREDLLISAPHGRRLQLSRAHLAPHTPARARLRDKPDAAPWVPRVAWSLSLQRPKKNLERDGYGAGGFSLTTTRLPVTQGPRAHRRRGG
ncbi:MAG: hypothetical protein IT380_20740 [Myxococcales bacterium]|nr:hypothetical protein [Myxococcales bacterium]